MKRPRSFRLLLLLSALPWLAACQAFAGHPVRRSLARLPAGATPASAPRVPEPPGVPAAEAAASLFRGLEGVLGPLEALRADARAAGPQPVFRRLVEMERAVRRRYARGGFGGAVRSVVALAATGRVPLAPRAMADLIMDPAVERAVLGADFARPLGVVYALPGARRARYRIALLNRGEGPFRYDLSFTLAIERVDTPDGRVLLRYDPDALPRPEHVTLVRGGCLLEPDGRGGTRVREILVLGTDLRLLPPLQGQLTGLVLKTLRDRATNLWVRAWAPAGR